MNIEMNPGAIRVVQHSSRFPGPVWYLGLDAGQRQDHSALAAVYLSWIARGRCPVHFTYQFEPQLEICYLKRFPIGLSYEKLYNLIRERLQSLDPMLLPSSRQLIIDAGGPGPPLVDRLRTHLFQRCAIRPVIITGGKGANTLTGGYTGVPRRTIVSTLQLLFAAGSLKCDPDLEGWPLLRTELLELSGQGAQSGDSGMHDDLAIATGLAAWAAVKDYPDLLPDPDDDDMRDSPRRDGPLF